jgi:hypothetical protein
MEIFSTGTATPEATSEATGTTKVTGVPRQSVIRPVVFPVTQWNGFSRWQFYGDGGTSTRQISEAIGGTLTNADGDRAAANGDDGAAHVVFNASLANGAQIRRWYSGFSRAFQRRYRNLYCHWKFKVPSAYGAVTDRRWRFGLYATAADPASQNPGVACIEFVADATRDTTWQFATHDGTTYSIVDTGLAFAANDVLQFIEFGIASNGNAWYRVQGGALVEKATNLPPDSTKLDIVVVQWVKNTTGSTVGTGPAVTMYRAGIWW